MLIELNYSENLKDYGGITKKAPYPIEFISVNNIKTFLTELDEQEFKEYEQMYKEAFEIFNMNHYHRNDLELVNLHGKKALFYLGPKILEYKACRNFINKYKPLIDKFGPKLIDTFEGDYIFNREHALKIYNELKDLYLHKQELLEMCDKLEGLKITDFMYMKAPELSLSAVGRISSIEIMGFYTDGEQTYNPVAKQEFSSEIKYQVNIEKANMILEYHKKPNDRTRLRTPQPCLIVNNLLFDTNFLPTYEELYDFNIPTNLDYQRFEDFKKLEQEKESIITDVSALNSMSQDLSKVLCLLEDYTTKIERTKNMEETKDIVTKLDALREILADVEKLKDIIIKNSDVITEEEIEKRLEKRLKKRLEKSLHHYC